ncbi:MAG: hypothetical protein IID39_10690, partial [Planctomycetes bacterium]|nr:hypothetical protein [Planctomycetota bacterium]
MKSPRDLAATLLRKGENDLIAARRSTADTLGRMVAEQQEDTQKLQREIADLKGVRDSIRDELAAAEATIRNAEKARAEHSSLRAEL